MLFFFMICLHNSTAISKRESIYRGRFKKRKSWVLFNYGVLSMFLFYTVLFIRQLVFRRYRNALMEFGGLTWTTASFLLIVASQGSVLNSYKCSSSLHSPVKLGFKAWALLKAYGHSIPSVSFRLFYLN